MHDSDFPDDAAQTERTRATIMRYHLSWKHRDLEAVLALYHPDIEYHDFFQQRCMRLGELRRYVEDNLPRRPGVGSKGVAGAERKGQSKQQR